jgi:uncharacterized membrane protein YwzB
MATVFICMRWTLQHVSIQTVVQSNKTCYIKVVMINGSLNDATNTLHKYLDEHPVLRALVNNTESVLEKGTRS